MICCANTGWLFDLTHSWDLSFYMAGFWIVVAALLTGLISYTDNRHFFGSPLERGLEPGLEPGPRQEPGLESGATRSKSSSVETNAVS